MVITMKLLLLVTFLVFLLTFGSYCLFSPRSVQAVASKAISTGISANSSALKANIESNIYLIYVRAIGLLAYAICVVLAAGLYFGG